MNVAAINAGLIVIIVLLVILAAGWWTVRSRRIRR
jgi:hypothetical protein